MVRSLLAVTACASALFAASSATAASTVILDNFTRTSPGEAVTASFTLAAGTATTNLYAGFVEVLVSGTGFSRGPDINDAFYFTADGSQSPDYYKLGIGTSAEPLAPFTPSRNASRLITFIEGVGFVAPNTVPAYDADDNTYNFVIDLGALPPTLLSFGVLNGNFDDNGGQYNVTVWQLAENAVPEPGTWLMMIVGFGAVGYSLRLRRLGPVQAV